ncbi:MAG: hypothetical protein LM586_03330 [Desulfurococcales archaeon]|nr:hypothetical protein [Desulfurococcales archaeon]
MKKEFDRDRSSSKDFERNPVRREGRFDRSYGQPMERTFYREGEIEPRPNGVYCNPLCPFFRCAKKALNIRNMRIGNELKLVAYCSWVNDQCIAGSCQYAYCEKRYLLPGNKCLYGIEKNKKKSSHDMFKELEEEEKEARKLKDHFKKLSGRGADLY